MIHLEPPEKSIEGLQKCPLIARQDTECLDRRRKGGQYVREDVVPTQTCLPHLGLKSGVVQGCDLHYQRSPLETDSIWLKNSLHIYIEICTRSPPHCDKIN